MSWSIILYKTLYKTMHFLPKRYIILKTIIDLVLMYTKSCRFSCYTGKTVKKNINLADGPAEEDRYIQ